MGSPHPASSRSASWRRLAPFLALAAGLLAGTLAIRCGASQGPTPPRTAASPRPGASTAPERAPTLRAVQPRTSAPERTPPPGVARFPDGTWLPPLNGVQHAPPFPARECAPVVGIYTDPATGMEWFVHADGARSTTQMVRVEENGRVREEPGWVFGRPIAPRTPWRPAK